MNKKENKLQILYIVIALFFVNGCIDHSHEKRVPGKNILPEVVKNVAVTDIYGNISPERVNRILSPAKTVLVQMGLPDIAKVDVEPGTNENDPNMIKSYLRFRRSESLLKEGMPRREYQKISDDFFAYVDRFPYVTAMQKKAVDHYLKMNKQFAAIREAKKVISIDPNDMDTAITIAAVYNETGRYEEALQFLNLALQSNRSGTENVSTAIATLHMATSFAELGYTYAAAETYLRAWQLMKYHRQFQHYDQSIQKIMESSEFQLLLAARMFLQCGKIDDCIQTLRQVQIGPNFQQLLAYISPMVIDLPESQKVRFKLLMQLYLYLLADGEDADFVLRLFYNNCLKMSLHNEYIKVVQAWYGSNVINPELPQLISRHSYARALEYARRHTEARLVLNNSRPGFETAAVWLEFARIDRANQSFNEMLQEYINCLDAGVRNPEEVISEFENILLYDQAARDTLSDKIKLFDDKSFGALIIKALIAENNKKNSLAEALYQAALGKDRDNIVARKYLIRYYARVGKYQNLLVLAKGYDRPDIIMYVARAYQSLGKFDKSIDCYKKILLKDKYNQQAVIRLADLYRSLGQYGNAEKLLLRSARRHPEQDRIQVELIKLYSIWSMPGNDASDIIKNSYQRVFVLADNYSDRYAGSSSGQDKAETILQESLEELLDRHKKCKPARVVLCDSYFRTKKIDSAVSHASRLINMFSDDYELLKKSAEIFDFADKYELAAATRKIIWEKHQKTPDTLFAAMKALRLAGMPSESLNMLNNGIELFPDDVTFIENISGEAYNTYLILRNYGEGIDVITKWLDICRDVSKEDLAKSLKYKLALLLIYDSRFDIAVEQLKKLYSEFPESKIYAIQMLVRSLNIRGMYDDSASFLEQMMEVLPDNIFIILEYAYTLIEAGQPQLAIEYVENWQLENPDATNRQYALFNTYKRADEFQQAIDLTRKRLRSQSDDVDLLVNLVFCLIHQGDERSLNEASGIMDGLAKRNVDPFKWFDYRIILDLTRGNPEIASERIINMTTDPDSPAILAAQARIFYLSGDFDKAISMYQDLIKDFPDEAYYRSLYSFALEKAGLVDEAIEQLAKLYELESDNAMSKNNLAYTMITNNREPERAGRLIREAIYMAPENVAILDSVGWLYYKQGEFQIALDYIYHAAAADIIVDPELMDHLGDTLYRLGNPQKAFRYWQRGLKEINRRIVMEKSLINIQGRYQRKIEQYNSGQPVDVAPLFSEVLEN